MPLKTLAQNKHTVILSDSLGQGTAYGEVQGLRFTHSDHVREGEEGREQVVHGSRAACKMAERFRGAWQVFRGVFGGRKMGRGDGRERVQRKKLDWLAKSWCPHQGARLYPAGDRKHTGLWAPLAHGRL